MYYCNRMMTKANNWPNLSIRMSPDALKRAKVAAAAADCTIGQWLTEAIDDKIERQRRTTWESKWQGL